MKSLYTKRTGDGDAREDKAPKAARADSNQDDNQECTEQLAAHGYEVDPEIYKGDGGTWKPLIGVPPHIRIVYDMKDAAKTPLIAKRVRERSKETKILEYLHGLQPASRHIISLIRSIQTSSETWIILPKHYPIDEYIALNGSNGDLRFAQLGYDLIQGLTYLHMHGIAHLDIKPGNLVYGGHRLQIIDFDTAVEVEGEETEISGYRGTPGWTAPEIGEQDGQARTYSPMKADAWSCGRVLQRFVAIEPDISLSEIAETLTLRDPWRRTTILQLQNLNSESLSEVTCGLMDAASEENASRVGQGLIARVTEDSIDTKKRKCEGVVRAQPSKVVRHLPPTRQLGTAVF